MRNLHSFPLLALTSFLLAACPGDDTGMDGTADSGSTGTTAGTTTSEPTTTEPGTSTADTGTTTMAEPTTTGEPTTTTTEPTSATDGQTDGNTFACGEFDCEIGTEWCDWSDDSCVGKNLNATGLCQPRPEGCPEDYAPVCGCDGEVHPNECTANQEGVDVDANGDCEPPAGYFRCGYRFCTLDLEYCQVTTNDIAGGGDIYECSLAPRECNGSANCDCFVEEPCFGWSCEATPDGGTQVLCPGG